MRSTKSIFLECFSQYAFLSFEVMLSADTKEDFDKDKIDSYTVLCYCTGYYVNCSNLLIRIINPNR